MPVMKGVVRKCSAGGKIDIFLRKKAQNKSFFFKFRIFDYFMDFFIRVS